MKKSLGITISIILTVVFGMLVFPKNNFAVTKEVKVDQKVATASGESQSVKTLREKIASQAAKQRELNKKAYFGKLTDISSGNLTVKTKHGSKTVVTLESTKFVQVTSGSRKEVELSSLINGSEVVAFGTVDSKDILTARWVLYFPKKKDVKKDVFIGRIISKTGSALSLKSLKKENVTPVMLSDDSTIIIDGEESTIKKLQEGKVAIIIGNFNDNNVFEADKLVTVNLKLQLQPLGTATNSATLH